MYKLDRNTDHGSNSLRRVSSIGLGIIEQQNRHPDGFKGPPKSITLPPPPVIRFDSGTPQDTTTFPMSRRILPLPSPSCVGDQPTFTKHDIVSPFIPSSETTSSSSPPPLPPSSDDTAIPVLSLSPSFPSQSLGRMPNLSELPMLGDVDDDHYDNHGSLSVPSLIADNTMMREQQSLLSPAIQTYDEISLTGKTIWKFRINRLLGVGAFSKVYLAISEESDKKKSAIKMIGKSKMLKDLRMKSSVEREVAVLQVTH
ncbi:hypothetical protein BC941DRAFT_41426 [Chlamydoabsidia padenii]|nr:hypothetical protein BC941DRAFT_41426 [Chlamydoabsidia padenii]